MPEFLRHGYVLLLVMLSFVLFNADSISQAARDIGGLFGVGGIPAVSKAAVYYLRSYGLLFVFGFLGATPLPKQIAAKAGSTKLGSALELVLLAGLLLVCTAYLVDGSFSPFLYFRF